MKTTFKNQSITTRKFNSVNDAKDFILENIFDFVNPKYDYLVRCSINVDFKTYIIIFNVTTQKITKKLYLNYDKNN